MSIRQILTSKRLVVAAAIPAAVLASGAMVYGASYSAFSATTSSPTSNWTSGTVALADDDKDTALFTASNLKPGATGEKCILVSSTGSLASTVKLYGTTYATTKDLASQIDLKVEEGRGGSSTNCSGFTSTGTAYAGTLAAFGTGASAKSDFASGVGAWAAPAATTSAPATHTYKVTYTLQSDAPNTTQGGSASIGLTWEAQNS